ncbi:MAG TPA: pilus (MSHA type) biogenesis protein MshL, partial [Longimicrobiaceae bacterium]|nr:pilus (MSHA type) biogenesis protein MshL [Longimicrobiaceae bacterium]
MPTRMFSLDYISMSRSGVGSTVVQRRLSSVGGGQVNSGVFNRFGSGTDLIQSVSVSDLWEQIRVSLDGLVFDAPATDASTGTATASANGNVGYNGLARASGAFSRVGEDGRRLIINPMSGTILVSAPVERLGQVARFLATVEASVQRQVLIEAKIVEVELNRHSEFGIDWSFMGTLGGTSVSGGATHPLPSPTGTTNSSGGVEFTLGGAGDKVNVVLHALETQGDVRVLSSPRVSALNNQPAVINVTTDQVFFSVTRQPILGPNGGTIGFNTEVVPQQVAVGIVLNVFPQISADNTIIMNVRPVVTDLKAEKKIQLADDTQVSAPIIDRRESDTVVRVRGGETVVLGGLIQTSEGDESSGIPVLSSIPLIGGLFGGTSHSETRRELVIFLTPTIVAGQAPSGAGR